MFTPQPGTPQERDGAAARPLRRCQRDDLPAHGRQLDRESTQLADEVARNVCVSGDDLELHEGTAGLRVRSAEQDRQRRTARPGGYEIHAEGHAGMCVIGRHGHVHPVRHADDETGVVPRELQDLGEGVMPTGMVRRSHDLHGDAAHLEPSLERELDVGVLV